MDNWTSLAEANAATRYYPYGSPFECSACLRDFSAGESKQIPVTKYVPTPRFVRIPGMRMDRMVMGVKTYVEDVCEGCVEKCSICEERIEAKTDALYGREIVRYDGLGVRSAGHAWCVAQEYLGDDVDSMTKDEIAAVTA